MTMDEPKTNDDWLQLKLDVSRLFSAAPLSQAIRRRENPYTGRISEVRVMMDAVQDPAKHILLYGERGLGKTSLANTFWMNRRHSTATDVTPVFHPGITRVRG
jgi:predicted GTPase